MADILSLGVWGFFIFVGVSLAFAAGIVIPGLGDFAEGLFEWIRNN